MSLSEALEEKKYDIRLVARQTDKGFHEPQGYTQFVESLSDDSSMATQVNLEDQFPTEKH